jgi:hypothetical protein
MNNAGRPFTAKVNELLASGLRYADLETQLGHARSTAWLNNLVNGGRWRVNPPSKDTFPPFAQLFKTDVAEVCRMIAEEWFGIVQSATSPRVRALASRLDALASGDVQLVEALVQRLQPPPFKFDFEIQDQ